MLRVNARVDLVPEEVNGSGQSNQSKSQWRRIHHWLNEAVNGTGGRKLQEVEETGDQELIDR